ncbi:potassium channel family protein [Methanobrevibacter sp. TMH8]|uniref:potassium channel family protein n=1 Tax=Methanobrevibacter sp. TMH8 TaxID=2848611 RepID=UPI001CCAED91|nr:potassium channel family protein [Methanobrevibacter sp. TMH8]MBZ9571368.1 potassium channel family protein [Methanobrevibacter sp. TMH8]
MGSIFPFQAANRLPISQFDLIISLLLILFLAVNYFIFSSKKKEYNIRNVVVIILAIIPFEFIFLSIFGLEMGFYLSALLYFLIILHIIGLIFTLRIFGSRFISFSRKNGLGYGIIAITTIFVIGTILFYIFEGPVNPNVVVFEDSIWFSLVSITTTGFGDIAPVSVGGRIVAGFLMISGVSFTAFATASVAGSIIDNLKEEKFNREKNLEEYNKNFIEKFEDNQKELAEIKEILRNLEK